MGESQPPSRNVAITTPAMSPVDPPGACDVVNHDQLGAVTPAPCDVSSVCRPQIAKDKMIMYSIRMTQPSKRMVSLTPRIAMATTSRQITVATSQVSGLFEVWPGAIRLSTVEPISVMLPMLEVSAVISTRIPTAKPRIGESPRATHFTGAASEACQAFTGWYATAQQSIAPPPASRA